MKSGTGIVATTTWLDLELKQAEGRSVDFQENVDSG